jgi:DNA-directed RNA polymerase specialized sigma24 family protein
MVAACTLLPDDSIRRFLAEGEPMAADGLLSEIASEQLLPLLDAVVRSKLGRSQAFVQDIDDVVSEALMSVLGCLRDWKAGEREPIRNLEGYAVTCASQACDQYFRERFPNRHRLKSRLRYLLKPERGFDVWETPNREWIAGYAGWRGQAPVPVRETDASSQWPLEKVVGAVFDESQGPLKLDALVDLVARLTGVSDQPVDFDKFSRTGAERQPECAPDLDERWMEWARQTWDEIRQLPAGQRVALLLNLRGEGEGRALALFPVAGVASLRAIAEALEMEPEGLAGVWSRLPLPDLEIADRLKVTRQQVINLRLSARRRLERRMGAAVSALRQHRA